MPPRLSNTGYVAAYKTYSNGLGQKENDEYDGRLCVPLQAGAEISTVNPEQYSKRFYDFITTILS